MMSKFKVVAVLSSTVLTEGTFKCQDVGFADVDLAGVPSFVGHPDTKTLLERLGVESVPGLFLGLSVGESFLAVPLANNKREPGWTVDQAVAGLGELRAKLVTRLE